MTATIRLRLPRVLTSWLQQAGPAIVLSVWTISLSPAQTQTPQPAAEPVRTSITVAERITAEAPAFLTVLGKEEIERQPSVNLDDRLRAVPGFSLFRRSSSLVANPTTQGVSLRGLGSSGASRSLILWDGVPINDPFGGWIYWTRVDPEQIERVEVSRGASTSVFGDRAMSGAVALFSKPAQPRRIVLGYEGGNRDTHLVRGGGSHVWPKFAVSTNVRAFTTGGYYVVRKDVRGAADEPAAVRFVTGDTRLDYLGAADRIFLKLDILAEARDNGTVLTRNSTGLGTLAAHYTRQWTKDAISALVYHTREEYRASFTSVTADRNSERITFTQTVPSQASGGAGMWRHNGGQWNLLAGQDFQRVSGTSTDLLVPTGVRVGGGSQLQNGTFGQLDASIGGLKLFAGARNQFTGQDSHFFSPSAGLAFAKRSMRARGTVYRSFRAPTLNELFRLFRVGNAETRANPELKPEELFGAEAGVDIYTEGGRIAVTLYRHSLEQLITNVTLSSTPQLIVRQRQNASSALARGLDISADRAWRNWRGEVGYLFADSRLSTGPRIPQVPRHQGMAQLTYSREGTLASAGIRAYSSQFEDDRNAPGTLHPGFATIQVSVRQRIGHGLSALVAIDNLADREYITGFTPTPLTGSPRLWRAGLIWDGRF